MALCYAWPSILRQVLEDLYYVAGIAIAVVAWKGLEQLRVTRDIAKKNAQREALRFAAERCQYFADSVAPAQDRFATAYRNANCTFLTKPGTFSVKGGELTVISGFNEALYNAESPRLRTDIPTYLNTLEAFAIPFIARMADDDLGYQETGISFSSMVTEVLPLLYKVRKTNYSGPYASTLRLYEHWSERRSAEEAGQNLMKAAEIAKQRSKPGKIDPIGTDV